MFRTIGDGPSPWESLLPPELLRLPEELARVDALLDDPVFFAPFAPFDPVIGRPSTPVHASWLNQIEIFFSIVQKKVLTPNDFPSTGQLAATLLAFIARYNHTARPFNWKFTAGDLARLLQRISGPPRTHQPGRGRLMTPTNLQRHPLRLTS